MARDNIQRNNVNEENEHNWFGMYRAKVIDARDPKYLGRVKIWIPDLMPEPPPDGPDPCVEGLWAHPANNYMGGRNLPDMTGPICDFDQGWYQGSCLIPPEGSWMWIFFENGDPNWPYYFAAADTGARKVLPENQQYSQYEKKWTLIKTRMGRVVITSDDPDDERVEITGKKRLITNPPDGDDASVFIIDDNMTTIFLDERAGHEKLLIRDYRGNYINLRTNDNGVKDQLHIFMKDDIHIETLKNLYIKTGEDMHVENGGSHKLHAFNNIDVKAGLLLSETALNTMRMSYIADIRTAGITITDTAGAIATRNAGGAISDNAGLQCSRSTFGTIYDYASTSTLLESGSLFNIKTSSLALEGSITTNIKSNGPVNIEGSIVTEQCGAIPSISAQWIFLPLLAKPASNSTPANPYGERDQEDDNKSTYIPPDPIISLLPEPIGPAENPEGDDYFDIEEPPQIDEESFIRSLNAEAELILNVTNNVIPPIVSGGGGSTPPRERLIGVGHMFAISLKNEYRDKIIPSAKASGATHTGFYLLRDLNPGSDNQYLDDVSVWNNYRQPGYPGVVPEWDDWNNEWWDRFESFCIQAKTYRIGVIPTLFDFCCSPNDPFLNFIKYPYTTLSWRRTAQGIYITKVVDVLKSTGVDFILNLGNKSFNMNQDDNTKLLPDAGYILKLITFLTEELSIQPRNLSLTANSNRNLYSMNPMTHYKMFTGVKTPDENQINNEEYVDGNWGGTGRVQVFDDGKLIDGYVKYLNDSVYGLPCMNTWKMNYFDDGNHDINKMFAPRQREAMRIVLGITGSGNI